MIDGELARALVNGFLPLGWRRRRPPTPRLSPMLRGEATAYDMARLERAWAKQERKAARRRELAR